MCQFVVHSTFLSKVMVDAKFYHHQSSQNEPSRGVLIKRCSENMQQIYKRTPILKCGFNSYISVSVIWRFSMGVLYICRIFSEHLLLRTPLDDCFWKSLITNAQKIVLLAYPITQNQNLKKSYFCPFQHIIQ